MSPRAPVFRYFAYTVAKQASLARPVWLLFLLHTGHDLTTVGVAESAYHAGGLAGELPSGQLADRRGKGAVMAIGCALIAAAMLGLGSLRSRAGVLVSMAFWGFGDAFHSGAHEAWLFEHLASKDRSAEYASTYGRAVAMGLAAAALADVLGGLLSDVSYAAVFGLEALILATAAVLARSLPRAEAPRAAQNTDGGGRSLRVSALLVVWGSLEVVAVLAMLFSLPLLKGQLGSNTKVGAALAVSTALAMVGTLSANRAGQVLSRRRAAALSIASTGALLLGFVLLPPPWCLLPLIGRSFVEWALLPLLSAEVNALIGDRHRATWLSLNGFVTAALSLIGFPIAGRVADAMGPRAVLTGVGVFELGASLLILGLLSDSPRR